MVTSARRHYACHCCSMQAAEQHDAAKELLQQNKDDGGELHSAGTLAGTLILARKNGNHDKQAIKSGMTCKLAWHARSVHWMYFQDHNYQKHSRHTTAWQLQVKKDYHDTIRTTWHEQHDTARTIRAWHKHMNMTRLACNMMKLSCTNLLCSGYLVSITWTNLPSWTSHDHLRIQSSLVLTIP